MKNDPLIVDINQSIGQAIDDIKFRITDLGNQLDIDQATWALPIYEKELGIPTDTSKLLTERRSNIKSRLKGTGDIGATKIKIVTDSYTNGDVEVRVTNKIIIQFTSTRGRPSNVDDVKKVLEDIIPAHLAIVFEFIYLTWNEIDAADMSWAEWDALNLTWGELEVYKP